MAYWVYIMTNRSGGLYVGVTNDLDRRISEHKAGSIAGFAARYRMNRLIYYEEFQSIREAIDREKQLKRWTRAKKRTLIATINPGWEDLAGDPGPSCDCSGE